VAFGLAHPLLARPCLTRVFTLIPGFGQYSEPGVLFAQRLAQRVKLLRVELQPEYQPVAVKLNLAAQRAQRVDEHCSMNVVPDGGLVAGECHRKRDVFLHRFFFVGERRARKREREKRNQHRKQYPSHESLLRLGVSPPLLLCRRATGNCSICAVPQLGCSRWQMVRKRRNFVYPASPPLPARRRAAQAGLLCAGCAARAKPAASPRAPPRLRRHQPRRTARCSPRISG